MNHLVYSLWTLPLNDLCITRDSFEVSLSISKKYFDKTILYTDNDGKALLQHLPFDYVFTDLNCLGSEFKQVWTLGKVLAYKLAANNFGHFMHIDYDSFVTKHLPEHFTHAPIAAHHPECFESWDAYESFRHYLKYKDVSNYKCVPNTAIFGGTNTKFFNDLFEESMSFYNNNKHVFEMATNKHHAAAITTEQWVAGAYANSQNITINYLYDSPLIQASEQKFKGFTHLWQHANEYDFKNKLRELKNSKSFQ